MKKILFSCAAVILLAACNSLQNNKDTIADTTLQEPSPRPKQKITETSDSATNPYQSARGNADWNKKIIKKGELTLQVKDAAVYSGTLHDAIKQYGGYIASETQSQTDSRLETTVSIKVPVDKFDDMMNQLPGGAEKVEIKKISTDDVTGEMVDIRSRLQAKEQTRLKYLEFLKQSKNMEEVLKVQAEINDIQEAIESASGRMDYLRHQSAYSTVDVVYFQLLPGYQPVDERPGFFTRCMLAFRSGFHFFAEVLIGLISIWPLILAALAGVWILKKFTMKGAAARQKL